MDKKLDENKKNTINVLKFFQFKLVRTLNFFPQTRLEVEFDFYVHVDPISY